MVDAPNEIPNVSFEEHMVESKPPVIEMAKLEAEPMEIGTGKFKLELYYYDKQLGFERRGFLGRNKAGWATISKDAIILETFPDKKASYWRTADKKYLSVSVTSWVGFYKARSNATQFTLEDSPHSPLEGFKRIKSEYKNSYLSFKNGDYPYIAAWNSYAILDIKLIRE